MTEKLILAPIVLFIYNRPAHTRKTLEALSANTLAQESDLFIYADGAKENATTEQLEIIQKTREVARSMQWCKSVTIIESMENKGLANSIISGVTEIVNKYSRIIVLEDDIVTGKYFLEFMNTALEKYADEKRVWHITGYRYPLKQIKKKSSYFYPVMDCWGWATWADRWYYYKKDALYYKSIFTKKMINKFNMDGVDIDKWNQIERNLSGEINTWAIFWGASIFEHNGFCLGPCVSLVKNIGFDNSGEHCKSNDRLLQNNALSDNTRITKFPKAITMNKYEYRKNKQYIILHRGTLVSIMGMMLPEFIKISLRKIFKINYNQKKE